MPSARSAPLTAGTRASAAAAVVAAYRTDPVFSARTLLVTVFGDSLRPRGGEAWTGSLVELLGPLGISERLTRTSLNRLVGEGLLTTRRAGRSSFYRVTPSADAEFARAEERIYHRRRPPWDGHWVVVVELAALPAPARAALRQHLGWLGFTSPAPGVMICPTGAAEAAAVVDDLGATGLVALFNGPSASRQPEGDDRRLVELTSGLADLVPAYRDFVDRFAPLGRAAAAEPDPEAAFCARTLLVHAYRRLTLREPELPAGLWPPGWIGDDAHRLAARVWHRLAPAAEDHLSAVCSRTGTGLDPLDPTYRGRFT